MRASFTLTFAVFLWAAFAFWSLQPAAGRAGGRVPAPAGPAKADNGHDANQLAEQANWPTVITDSDSHHPAAYHSYYFSESNRSPELEGMSVPGEWEGAEEDEAEGEDEDRSEDAEAEDEYYDADEYYDYEDDRDGCGTQEIRYFRSGLCVPVKCARGFRRDGATGRCDPKPGSGDIYGDPTGVLGSGSIYTYGPTKYFWVRSKYRLRGKQRWRKVGWYRPKQFARWYQEANPDTAVMRPMTGNL